MVDDNIPIAIAGVGYVNGNWLGLIMLPIIAIIISGIISIAEWAS